MNPRLTLLAIASLSSIAAADTVTLSFNPGNNPSPSANVAVSTGGSWYVGPAGEMNFKVTAVNDVGPGANPFAVGQNLVTFCTQSNSPLSNPDTYTIHYVPFTDNNATLLQELYAAHFNDIGTDGSKAAAFQLAVWEIVNDAPNSGAYAPGSNAFTSGAFQAGFTSSTVLNTAKSWLADFQTVSPGTANQWAVYELDAGQYGQSQLWGVNLGGSTPGVQPVPLPAALPAGLSVLAALGLIRKLRPR